MSTCTAKHSAARIPDSEWPFATIRLGYLKQAGEILKLSNEKYSNKQEKYSNNAMRNTQIIRRNIPTLIGNTQTKQWEIVNQWISWPPLMGGPRPSEKLTWRVPIPPNLALPSAVFALKEDFLDLMHGKHYSSIATTWPLSAQDRPWWIELLQSSRRRKD